MDNKLYVGNLPYDITEQGLTALFGESGSVTSVAIIKDRHSGQSKGFGFVEMSSQVEAEDAIQRFNGYDLGGRQLKVSIARPREEKGPRQGGGQNQGRGGFDPRRGGGGRQGDRRRSGGGGGGRERDRYDER
jgi:cold-inducible RNA-binding protein